VSGGEEFGDDVVETRVAKGAAAVPPNPLMRKIVWKAVLSMFEPETTPRAVADAIVVVLAAAWTCVLLVDDMEPEQGSNVEPALTGRAATKLASLLGLAGKSGADIGAGPDGLLAMSRGKNFLSGAELGS